MQPDLVATSVVLLFFVAVFGLVIASQRQSERRDAHRRNRSEGSVWLTPNQRYDQAHPMSEVEKFVRQPRGRVNEKSRSEISDLDIVLYGSTNPGHEFHDKDRPNNKPY